MKELQIDITNPIVLNDAAKKLLVFAGDNKVLAFYAEMGAGKTTFIKELCKVLGSADNFSSPTYSIVNEYHFPGGKIFHFDLYRINSIAGLLDIGIEEYLHSGNYCFIEWPELCEEILPRPYLKVDLKLIENKRYLCSYFIE